MIPRKVELENFLSFGPRQVIEFSDDEPLWVLSGPNGVGKSTVFDAMTFCLFGMHRGKGSEVGPLRRHGANSFSVSFEFEFIGQRYRISRSRTGESSAQSLHQWINQQWQRVPNVEGADDIKRWSVQTLGLDFEGFKSSVLLRQGKADEIVDATATTRMAILKSIIGMKDYESLSTQISERSKQVKEQVDQLQKALQDQVAITPEQLQAAQAASLAADAALLAANTARDEAIAAQEQARQWEALTTEEAQLRRESELAVAAVAARPQLQQQCERLKNLQKHLPHAEQFSQVHIQLRDLQPQIAELEQRHAEILALEQQQRRDLEAWKLKQAEARSQASDRTAQLREHEQELQQINKIINLAQDVEVQRHKVSHFTDDLDSQHDATEEQFKQRSLNERELSREVATRQGELQRLQQALQRMNRLEVGVACSQCGQPVTAEHAKRERQKLQEQLTEVTRQIQQIESELIAAQAHLQQTEALRLEQQRLLTARDQAVQRLRDREADLTQELRQRGGAANLTELLQAREAIKLLQDRREQERQEIRLEEQRAERQVQQLASSLPQTQRNLSQLTASLEQSRQQIIRDQSLIDLLTPQLPPDWQQLNLGQLTMLRQELQDLENAKVLERLQQAERHELEQSTRQLRLQQLLAQLEQIPTAGRRRVAEAQAFLRQAREEVQQAEKQAQALREKFLQLTEQEKHSSQQKKQLSTVERQWNLLSRLGDLLGKKGLQRELVREAEERIVELANDTVQNLSDGDLRIQLNRSERGENEALVLEVRQGHSPSPTRVEYLSGSQKFRVAIALALAIGRYAAGQARPLQSVIIDEGFGSLDKNGLRAVAEELINLTKHLDRIILVSHQEEFTEHFPVVIQLKPSDAGTLAEVCRKR